MWTFRCYTSQSGQDLIDEWYVQQDAEVRANVDTTIEFLGTRPRHEWVRPQFDLLSDGIGEIRIKARSGHYRLLGYFGPTRLTFTLLKPFHKGRKSDTDKAIKTAKTRRKETEEYVFKSKECFFP